MNRQQAFESAVSAVLEDLGYSIYDEHKPGDLEGKKRYFKVVTPSGGVIERIEFDG